MGIINASYIILDLVLITEKSNNQTGLLQNVFPDLKTNLTS